MDIKETKARGDNAAHAPSSPWRPFHRPVFRALWIATLAANTGTWIYNAAAGWLMTSLNSDPLIVSLVQVATSLPMFLLALPAGALADVVDKRRFIALIEVLMAIASACFALLVTLGIANPPTLLLFMFVIPIEMWLLVTFFVAFQVYLMLRGGDMRNDALEIVIKIDAFEFDGHSSNAGELKLRLIVPLN